jgi:hypothetical protein
MNDLRTLPPERDLPGADEIRRSLVATVATDRHRAGSKLLPAVAAGAVVLAAGGVAVAVALLGSPGAVVSPAAPPGDYYAQTCLPRGGPGGGPTTPPPTPMAGVPAPTTRVVFTDRYGQLAVVGSRTDFIACLLQPDGTHKPTYEATSISSGIALDEIAGRHVVVGWVDYGKAVTVPAAHGTSGKAFGYYTAGWVGPDVTSITVTWTGQPPVRAAVSDGFFVARLVLPAAGHTLRDLGFVLRAFDVNGRQVAVIDQKVPIAGTDGVYVSPTS